MMRSAYFGDLGGLAARGELVLPLEQWREALEPRRDEPW